MPDTALSSYACPQLLSLAAARHSAGDWGRTDMISRPNIRLGPWTSDSCSDGPKSFTSEASNVQQAILPTMDVRGAGWGPEVVGGGLGQWRILRLSSDKPDRVAWTGILKQTEAS
jgi:hypothetical protein